MPEITAPSQNPLKKYFRQPKLYVSLPSKGEFYPPGTIEVSESGEYAVFPMTARDELTFKTPDALINGQSTVDVIQSCVPAIKDAWAMPTLDLDAVLIAIRVASYGENMTVSTVIPKIMEKREFQTDLRILLDQLYVSVFEDTIHVDDLIIKIRPLTYREFTQCALKTFEEQRVFSIVNDDDMSEEDKIEKFNKSFKKLTEMTVGMVISSIVSIQAGEDTVTSPQQIKEFIENADKKFYKTVVEHVEEQKKKFSLKPLKVQTDPDDVEKGAPETFEVPISFDQSNFFV